MLGWKQRELPHKGPVHRLCVDGTQMAARAGGGVDLGAEVEPQRGELGLAVSLGVWILFEVWGQPLEFVL